MRRTSNEQLPLIASVVNHPHARELQAISASLDRVPEALAWVRADLVPRGVSLKRGREGMSAELVLRCVIAKQMNAWSYEELAFHLGDSLSYRAFCRLGIGERAPKTTTLKRNIKRLRPETLERINRLLLERAKSDGVETGRTVRTDCTVEETNIHAPSDSALLWDCVRVLTRLLLRATELVPLRFTDHRRRAKRRSIGIQHAPTPAKRLPLYRDLMKVTAKTVLQAETAASALDGYRSSSMTDVLAASALAGELRAYVKLAHRVMEQTRRRVFDGHAVPAAEKVVSIFEPHTDIIVKDRRETYYGHKLAITTGASGLVIDCVVEEGNPADSTLATKMVQRQSAIYGRPPRQVCFDGGFASAKNVDEIKTLGVDDVCFSKSRFLKVTDMVRSSWVYRKLRRFRAGIEAGISFLKRCFGLDRCTWKGFRSFKAYTWASVVAHNFLVLARHALG